MAKKGSFSKVYDKNGDYADVEAVRFDGTRTVQMQGDVTASQTWNGDPSSPLTLNASIGAKKVTQDKIGDKAVGTGQMADGSVGLTQMAASAMTDTVSANNSKLVTSQGVNAAIAAATLNRGKDYGPLSVDEINAISETIPTGSTVYVESLGASDAKVINDGYSDGTMSSFSVEVGEDLKYYRSPDNSLHGWYSTEANVKIKQPANYSGGIAVDSAQDASSGSAGIEFIQSFKQNTNGDIRDIVKAQVDIVDSTSSTRTNAAATPNSVKTAYDLANTANTGLANKLDKTGDGKDVTVSFSEASSRENIGTGEKLSVMFGKIKKWFTDLGTAAFKNVPASGDASSTEVVLGSDTRLSAGASAIQGVKVNNTTLTPDANKVVTVPLATTSADGAMSAADKTKLNGIAAGAEANVQADWNVTNDSSDAFIKNKPQYTFYSTAATYAKICSFSLDASGENVSGYGIDILYRRYLGEVHGRLLYKKNFKLYCEYTGDISYTNQSYSFYYVVNSNKMDVYAKRNGYTTLNVAPLTNIPKEQVDFTDFGTVVSALPEGATEITPVWVANSASSSGTAPVKVGAYGALTPVPMDSTPTASSTNLMTSGDIKTALDAKADADNSVTIYDASIARVNTSGDPWYKIAEVPLKNALQFRNAEWDVFANVNDDPGVYKGRLILKSQSNASAVTYAEATLYADAWNSNVFNFKIVAKTTLNNGYVQIWAKAANNISSLSISERFLFGGTYKPQHKGLFTYTSYDSVAGSAEPQTDAQNNIVASPAKLVYRIQDIEYVAAQSGGGGNLNKTINGTTTSVLAFMNDSEAVAIWNDAKTAAANAS